MMTTKAPKPAPIRTPTKAGNYPGVPVKKGK